MTRVLEAMLDEKAPERLSVAEVLSHENDEAVHELHERIRAGRIGATILHQMVTRIHKHHGLSGLPPTEYKCRRYVKDLRGLV